MSNGFNLANTLMQLSSLKEQRRARREEQKFKRMYEAPLKEAYTKYYTAMSNQAASKELTTLQKEQKRKTGLEADQLQLALDEIAKLQKDDPTNPLISQAVFGISNNQEMANEISMMRARFQEQSLKLQESQVLMGQAVTRQKLLFEDSAEGAAVRAFMEERGILNEAQTDAIEGTFGREIPEKGEDKGILDRIRDLLVPVMDRASSPVGGVITASRKAGAAPSKARPIQSKVIEKPKEIPDPNEIALGEMNEVLIKAEENDVNRLDVYTGIQKLVQEFPKMSNEDRIGAAHKLAEGFTIEEVIEHYQEEKNE